VTEHSPEEYCGEVVEEPDSSLVKVQNLAYLFAAFVDAYFLSTPAIAYGLQAV